MAEVAGTLVTSLLQRVRDPQGAAHSRDVARSILDYCQQIINAFTGQVYETVTISAGARQQIHNLRTLAPNYVHIQDAKQEGRSLSRTDTRALFYYSRDWARDVGPRREAFAELGLDIAIFYPATAEAVSLDVTSTKITAPLVDEDVATELPDEVMAAALSMAEAILQLRQRNLADAATAMQTMTTAAAQFSRG